jgi:hypothetical protein
METKKCDLLEKENALWNQIFELAFNDVTGGVKR